MLRRGEKKMPDNSLSLSIRPFAVIKNTKKRRGTVETRPHKTILPWK
jgi:hypothetical protein